MMMIGLSAESRWMLCEKNAATAMPTRVTHAIPQGFLEKSTNIPASTPANITTMIAITSVRVVCRTIPDAAVVADTTSNTA